MLWETSCVWCLDVCEVEVLTLGECVGESVPLAVCEVLGCVVGGDGLAALVDYFNLDSCRHDVLLSVLLWGCSLGL